MNRTQIEHNLDRIFSGVSADGILAEIVDFIMDERDELEWNKVEKTIIFLNTLQRWVLGSGFRTYLLMPGSENCEETLKGLKKIGVPRIASALDMALQVFSGIELDDVEGRQAQRLTERDDDILDKADDIFYQIDQLFFSKIRDYIISHRKSILA